MRLWAWLLIGVVLAFLLLPVVVAIVWSLTSDEPFVEVDFAPGFGTDPLPTPSPTPETFVTTSRFFLKKAEEGTIESVEVNGDAVRFKVQGDETTFRFKLEEGVTVHEMLELAGIEPEDFPPIE